MLSTAIPNDKPVHSEGLYQRLWFTLMALQVAAFWAPPSRFRKSIFAPAIAATAYVLLSKRPPGDNLLILYFHSNILIASLRPFVELVLTVPEKSFWRAGEQKEESLTYGAFGLNKLRWALSLLSNNRGIGWNYLVKGIPATTGNPEFLSKEGFLFRRAIKFVVAILVGDLCTVYHQSRPRAGHDEELKSIADGSWIQGFMGILSQSVMVFLVLHLQSNLPSIVCVALRISNPEDWPSMFGPVGDAVTIRKVWGSFWHQTFRRLFSQISGFVLETLRIPRGTNLSSYTQLYTAFFVSGLMHAFILTDALPFQYGVLVATGKYISTLKFFWSQPLLITFEDAVIALYKRYCGSTSVPKFARYLGYAWVISWFWFSLPWYFDDIIRGGGMIPKTVVSSVIEAFSYYF